MRVITSAKDIPKCALALGNFDGLHLAHMRLADDCLKYARAHNLSGGMLIFAQHSKTVTKNRDIKHWKVSILILCIYKNLTKIL